MSDPDLDRLLRDLKAISTALTAGGDAPPKEQAMADTIEEAIVTIGVWHEALVSLSTQVHYSARDTTGEASTRRVQDVAVSALRLRARAKW